MTDIQVVNFIEWVVERLPPKYGADIRNRFTPQVVINNEPLVWIETHTYSRSDPKFYTTQEVLELYKIYKQTQHETN